MVSIGILKERADRRVVVLSPAGVERLGGKATVLVQRDAGRAAGFTNEAYTAAGAQVVEREEEVINGANVLVSYCLLYTSPSPRDRTRSRMTSSA